MKVCVEGPNGIGKTTFIEEVMAKLSLNEIKSDYVKLKPRPSEIDGVMTGEYPYLSMRKDHVEAAVLTDRLVMQFTSELTRARDEEGKVKIFDRGILSTYIYGIMTYQYLTGRLKNLRESNIFKGVYPELYYLRRPVRRFISWIEHHIKTCYACHKMDICFILIPSNVGSNEYYKSAITREKQSVIYDHPTIFKRTMEQYKRFVEVLDSDNVVPFVENYREANKTIVVYKIKTDYSNMDKVVDEAVEEIMRRFSK